MMTRSRRSLQVVAPLAQPSDELEGALFGPDYAFRRYGAYVAAIALRLLGRDDEVDDVVQEVFLAAVKGLVALRDEGALRAWLASVTVRVVRRKLKLRRVRAFFGLD